MLVIVGILGICNIKNTIFVSIDTFEICDIKNWTVTRNVTRTPTITVTVGTLEIF